jgi:hypothetical protein
MLFYAIISIARPDPRRNSAVHSANIIRLQEAIFSVVREPMALTLLVSRPEANLLKSLSGRQKR